jgi:hypothetical protein
MDIMAFIVNNSEMILMVITVLLAFIARYFQAQSGVLARAAEALIELQQEFLNDIRDSVISQAELEQILIKVQAAEAALRDVLAIFTTPVPITEKVAMIFGGGESNRQISRVWAQVQTMKLSRMNRR